jgi:hypothetical protein
LQDDELTVSYYLCTTSHAYGAEAVLGAATVLVAAIHTTAEFTPGSIPQPIHVVDTNLNNGDVFCSLLASPKSASVYERVCFTGTKNLHLGQLPPRPVAGLPTHVVNDKGRYVRRDKPA